MGSTRQPTRRLPKRKSGVDSQDGSRGAKDQRHPTEGFGEFVPTAREVIVADTLAGTPISTPASTVSLPGNIEPGRTKCPAICFLAQGILSSVELEKIATGWRQRRTGNAVCPNPL